MKEDNFRGVSLKYLVERIPEKLWPTPTCSESEHPDAELTPNGRRKTRDGKDSHSLNLADSVRLWPTPVTSDYKRVDPTAEYSVNHGWCLPMAVKFNSPGGGMKKSEERMRICGLPRQHQRTPQEGRTAQCSGCSATPPNQDAGASLNTSPSTDQGDVI